MSTSRSTLQLSRGGMRLRETAAMRLRQRFLSLICVAVLGSGFGIRGEDASSLRLVPFPKEATLQPGDFSLNRRLILEISQGQAQSLGEELLAELRVAGFAAPALRPIKTAQPFLRLSTK